MSQAVPHPVAAEPPVRARMSYADFLAWAGDDVRAEWVDGEVSMMAPVSGEHSDVALLLKSILQAFVQAKGLGVVRDEPFQMKAGPQLPGRSPDIMFVSRGNASRLRDKYLDGPADLVIEVISPESRARDRGEKFFEYEQGGVREYWLIDPLRKQAEFYQRGDDGIYRAMPIGADGVFRSVVLKDLWLDVGWLWQRPLPSLLDVLRRWRLV